MAKILTFNLDAQQMFHLRRIAGADGVVIREVAPAEFDSRIIDLVSSESAAAGATAFPKFADEMMLFVDFEEDRLYGFLRMMRESGIRHIPLKASLTEHNRNWTPVELSVELRMENEEMKKMMKK